LVPVAIGIGAGSQRSAAIAVTIIGGQLMRLLLTSGCAGGLRNPADVHAENWGTAFTGLGPLPPMPFFGRRFDLLVGQTQVWPWSLVARQLRNTKPRTGVTPVAHAVETQLTI
jgi:hypothetical protein